MKNDNKLPYNLEVSQYPGDHLSFNYNFKFSVQQDLSRMNSYSIDVRKSIVQTITSDFKRTLDKVVFPELSEVNTFSNSNQVTRSSINWWESKRPIEWMLETHLENPTVNCSSETEKNLAIEVAKYIGEKL